MSACFEMTSLFCVPDWKTLGQNKMNLIFFILLLLVFLTQPDVVIGGQVALRPQPKHPLLRRSIPSRSIPIDSSIFDPTDEESFYVAGGEIQTSFVPDVKVV